MVRVGTLKASGRPWVPFLLNPWTVFEQIWQCVDFLSPSISCKCASALSLVTVFIFQISLELDDFLFFLYPFVFPQKKDFQKENEKIGIQWKKRSLVAKNFKGKLW